MENTVRCQSCGMPMGEGFYGTEAGGGFSPDYCTFCYAEGAFTLPDLTADGMVERSVSFMTSSLGFSEDQARSASRAVIPGLKRWR